MQPESFLPPPVRVGVPTEMAEKEAPGVAHAGNGDRVSKETNMDLSHRGRDAAGLAVFVMLLAALWMATFLWVERPWGEYRPATGELQEPPPPPNLLIPALSLEEARQIVEQAGTASRSAHDQP